MVAGYATETIPIGAVVASDALVVAPVLTELAGTAVDGRVPSSASVAGNAVEAVPVLSSGAGAGVERGRPDLSERTCDTTIGVPVGVRWALTLVIEPDLSIGACDAVESIPVGSSSALTSVTIGVQHLSDCAGRHEDTDSSEEDVTWTAATSVKDVVPD